MKWKATCKTDDNKIHRWHETSPLGSTLTHDSLQKCLADLRYLDNYLQKNTDCKFIWAIMRIDNDQESIANWVYSDEIDSFMKCINVIKQEINA